MSRRVAFPPSARMAPATIPTSEPARLAAGDTWRWDRAVSGYLPADGWALTYTFAGKDKLNITAAMAVANAAQSGWEITVPAATTAALGAGVYAFEAYVTKSGERYTVLRGTVTVSPNLVTANAGDLQSHEERTLAVLDAAIEGRLSTDMEEYQIGGRAVKRIPINDLLSLRTRYALAVRRQRNRGKTPQTVAAFVRP